MIRNLAPVIALLVLQSAALAEKRCTEPYAPDISISAKSSRQDVLQLRDDVQSFLQASDLYQKCLADAARNNPTLDLRLNELIDTNQQQKQRVADALNAAISSFNSVNGGGNLKLSDAKQ